MHSESKSTLRQLSQVQEEDMVDLLEAEELPFDDTGFLPHSSQPIEVPITAYTDYVADYAHYLSRSAPASEYGCMPAQSSQGSTHGSIPGSVTSLLDDSLIPATSWEHISVRKANQVSLTVQPSKATVINP